MRSATLAFGQVSGLSKGLRHRWHGAIAACRRGVRRRFVGRRCLPSYLPPPGQSGPGGDARSTDNSNGQPATPDDRRAFEDPRRTRGLQRRRARCRIRAGYGPRQRTFRHRHRREDESNPVEQRLPRPPTGVRVEGIIGGQSRNSRIFTVDKFDAEAAAGTLALDGDNREDARVYIRRSQTAGNDHPVQPRSRATVDGEQIGTALWTGCSLMDLRSESGAIVSHVVFRAADVLYHDSDAFGRDAPPG